MSWRLAHSLRVLREEFNDLAPHRSKATDGTIGDPAHAARASRHNPNAHRVVTALDITHDPAGGCDVHAIARAHVAAGPHPELAYIVSDGEIASRSYGWRWRPYTGSNKHRTHAHFAVGVGSDGAPQPPYDSNQPWGIATPNGPIQEDEDMPVTAPDDVRYWQNVLKTAWPAPHDKAGPPYDIGDTDGVVGPRTAGAIRDWQEKRGIEVTGTLTATTIATLQSHANRAYATQQAATVGGVPGPVGPVGPKGDRGPRGAQGPKGTVEVRVDGNIVR